MKLNLGCGTILLPSWENVDKYPIDGATVADVEKGLPYPDGIFDFALMSHSLEHCVDVPVALKEVCRVLRPGGTLRVVVPYGLRALKNPMHHHAFDLSSFEYLTKTHSSLDAPHIFELVSARITDRRFPFKWHIHRYLPWLRLTEAGWDGRIRSRRAFGLRYEITFDLRKVVK